MLSAISGIGYSILTIFISFLLKSSSRLLKSFGIIILIGLFSVCWYSSLVVAATRGVYNSNMWAI